MTKEGQTTVNLIETVTQSGVAACQLQQQHVSDVEEEEEVTTTHLNYIVNCVTFTLGNLATSNMDQPPFTLAHPKVGIPEHIDHISPHLQHLPQTN